MALSEAGDLTAHEGSLNFSARLMKVRLQPTRDCGGLKGEPDRLEHRKAASNAARWFS